VKDPNNTYQEMKADVTEVPASLLLPDGAHNATGTNTIQTSGLGTVSLSSKLAEQ